MKVNVPTTSVTMRARGQPAADDLGDDEVRASLGLVVDPAQVLADQAEEEELDSREEHDRDDERREALR